ncbi:hypothetical protein MMC25_001136 [Agyrium rufum]|nr:hypothetical protein [Agyrium rufum]
MSPVFTLGAFLIVAATTDRGFDTSRIFASLSLLTLMAHPLGSLFQQFPQIRGAGVALRRVEEYLLLESRQDLRSFEKSLEGNGKSNGYKITERPVSSEGSESSNGKTVPRSQLAHSNAITVESGTFGWTAEKAILKNVSFDIKRSKLTVIVGPVASGKTTLCKGLLGETPITEGKIMVYPGDPSIAFCDQTTFLNNTTIRANIVGVSAYESSWFDTVVDAVALREDIASFPEGDQSFVGSNGITLSGGQRQRVSIARAVYARKGIAIFDDVVSGLDAKTQKHVFERVFAEGGLLAQSGTTVILSTHAVHLLPSAHHIIALGTKGEIVEQGTFRDLDTGDGYIKSLAISVLGAASSAPEDALLPPKESGKSQGGAKDYQKSLLRQTSDFATYVYYFRAIGAKTMTTLLTFGFIFSTLIVLPQLWIRVWTNPDNSSPWTGGWSNVAYWGVYAGLQGTCYVFLCLFVHHAFIVLIADSGLRLHWETLKTVMAAPMSFFSDTDTGSITNRFTQDMQLIDGLLPGGLMNFITCSLTMISQAIMIAIASPFVALTYPPIILVFSVIQRYYLRTSQQLRIIDIEAKEPLYTHVLETMKGLVTVRAFGWSDSYVATCNDILDGAQRPAYLLWIVQQWLTMVLDLTGAMIAVLVVSLAVNLRSDSGFVAVALLSIMSFAAYIRFSVMSWTSVETSMGAISRIKTFSEQTLPEDLENEKGTIDPYWPEKGQIEVQDLTVSYKPGSGKNALNNLSLSIKSGEKIGVCGRTGSGKSTFILSLFRMIEIQQGSVIIDGTDISTIPRQEVRRRLNALPQEPILFSGTWRTNLDPYGFSTDEAMLEGLEKVGLRTTIEDRGGLTGEMNIEALSHGQRQLFCLARAILRPGSVVALDEATSNVDKDTEKKMQDIIRTEFKGRTIIAVAHNLSTLMDFDRIAFLREGQLIEYDSPKALLERDSAFKQLYEAQNSSAAGEGTS